MEAIDVLLADGAEVVGSVAYLNRVDMGRFAPGGFTLSEAGQKYMAGKEVKPAAPAPQASTKTKKQAAPAPQPSPLEEMTNLLAS